MTNVWFNRNSSNEKTIPVRSFKQHNFHCYGKALGQLLFAGVLFLSYRAWSAEEALFIDAVGNVGIGTSEPQATLDVKGKVKAKDMESTGNINAAELKVSGKSSFNDNVVIHGKPEEKSVAPLDIGQGTRSPKNHPDKVPGLYVTGEFEPAKGVEFRHNDGTEGIGLGKNTIYAAGNNSNQNLNLKTKGTGIVIVDSPLEVKGHLDVKGHLNSLGQYQLDNNSVSTYEISPRYHLTITAPDYHMKSKQIPHKILVSLCGDLDGCQVRLAMTDFTNDQSGKGHHSAPASETRLFYYNQESKHWRSNYPHEAWGKDGDGTINHVFKPWSMCHFTDGEYKTTSSGNDIDIGMNLLLWNGYTGKNRKCHLTLID